jgi:hypothetical protein
MTAFTAAKAELQAEIAKLQAELDRLRDAYGTLESLERRALGKPRANLTSSSPATQTNGAAHTAIQPAATMHDRIAQAVRLRGAEKPFTVPELESTMLDLLHYQVPGKARSRLSTELTGMEKRGKVMKVATPPGKPHVWKLIEERALL